MLGYAHSQFVVAFTTLFILLVTYDWAEQARVFVPGKPFKPCILYHSSLSGPVVCYKENCEYGIWFLMVSFCYYEVLVSFHKYQVAY